MKQSIFSGFQGAGLGLRRDFLSSFLAPERIPVDFLEVAPENWMKLGGRLGRAFAEIAARYRIVTHGLSLSIGGLQPLDVDFLTDLKVFLQKFQIEVYSEHLSYCSDGLGHLYDLMPIPFTEEAVSYVANRIRQVQDILERKLIIENVSYYGAPSPEMTEIDFLKAVLQEADCHLLLDVNNIYVNSINHGYDPKAFIAAIPTSRIQYIHIAGHYNEAPDLRVDTHGADVIDPVWDLLRTTYQHHGVYPTLLERDFNIPSVEHLLGEVGQIRMAQAACLVKPESLWVPEPELIRQATALAI
jgi:uncharacterized protein